MFYDDELRACADVMLRQSFCQWEGLPNKGFPVIFKGVNGKDEREKKSPSFFNPQEVDAVLGYVQSLKETKVGGMSIKADDIGIISPYHQQVGVFLHDVRDLC